MKKKIFVMIMVMVMMFALAACGNKVEDTNNIEGINNDVNGENIEISVTEESTIGENTLETEEDMDEAIDANEGETKEETVEPIYEEGTDVVLITNTDAWGDEYYDGKEIDMNALTPSGEKGTIGEEISVYNVVKQKIGHLKVGIDLYDSLNNVESYLDFLFQDWDFLYVDDIYDIYKRNPKILEKYLHIDIEKYVELMPRDIQEEYRMLEERKNKKMENRNGVTFNITGGQVNFAKDNANINATQNNGISGNELDVIIKAIKDNLSGLKKEEADEIIDVVDMAKEELTKPEPKTSRLRNCITLIAPMITIANGIPVLANNLQKLQEFIMQCIK